MLIRRPAHVRFEYLESPEFSLENLVSGGAGIEVAGRWLASAAHLDAPIQLEFEDLALFQAVPEKGIEPQSLSPRSAERLHRLLDTGLLLADEPAQERQATHARRDAEVRATGWWGPAALAHGEARWDDVDVGAAEASEGKRRVSGMIEKNGLPPPEALTVGPADARLPMPTPRKTAFDELLAARTTCRNFDEDFVLPAADLSSLLHRVFGAQASHEIQPGAVMLKKNSPSGGSLHPIEAFLLVRRVEGLAPGLYHYHCLEHALEPMRSLPDDEAARAAYELVAGQAWFAKAPVLVLMAARFDRNYWKYRNHAKAWKVIQLDAGHLSQNLYLSATELGYGAYITGAINDRCAERLFELDGMRTGAVAVCGFGKRAAELVDVEFDPLGKAVR
jgi:putative peptide maturation dehydrogenase